MNRCDAGELKALVRVSVTELRMRLSIWLLGREGRGEVEIYLP